MADYFDRLVERARGAAIGARPPIRATFDPYATGNVVDPLVGDVLLDSDGRASIDAAESRARPRRGPPSPEPPPTRTGQATQRASRGPRAVDASTAGAATPGRRSGPSTPSAGDLPPWTAASHRDPAEGEDVPATTLRPASLPPSQPDAPLPKPVQPSLLAAAESAGPGLSDRRASLEEHGAEQTRPSDALSRVRPAATALSPSAPASPPSATAPVSRPAQTIVRVSIGRVDVRAPAPERTPPPPARTAPAGPRLTLDAYLERAGERRRR